MVWPSKRPWMMTVHHGALGSRMKVYPGPQGVYSLGVGKTTTTTKSKTEIDKFAPNKVEDQRASQSKVCET